MTDALWNGIIGAGGAFICCAVYFGFKAARKGINHIKVKKPEHMSEQEINADSKVEDNSNVAKQRQLTITLPTKAQIFTRKNIRAYGFIVMAIISAVFAENIVCTYNPTGVGDREQFEGDYYTNASLNLYYIASNTKAVYMMIRESISYLFWILAALFAILGLTSVSFKNYGNP